MRRPQRQLVRSAWSGRKRRRKLQPCRSAAKNKIICSAPLAWTRKRTSKGRCISEQMAAAQRTRVLPCHLTPTPKLGASPNFVAASSKPTRDRRKNAVRHS